MSSESLQNELVAFVESHPETFKDPEIMLSNIIKAFDTMKETNSPGVGSLGVMILKHIVDNIKDNVISTSDDIHHELAQFGLCVDIINLFLERLCVTERHYNQGGYSSSLTPYEMCSKLIESVHPLSPLPYIGRGVPNINELVKIHIILYQAKVLKLWADVLIRQGKIKSDTIDKMKMMVSEQDGYERKMRELREQCMHRGSFKSNLDESILLEWLTLFYIASIAQITNTYANMGSLDYIVFGIVSQFVPLNNVYDYSEVPQSKNNASKLNVLRLTCYVVLPSTASIRLPIIAYLSSDELDQCARNLGKFPTAEEFLTSVPTAHERFQALKSRLRERQSAAKTSPIPFETPMTAHERFQALKSRLRERQMESKHGGKKIKSKINQRFQKSKKSCRKYRKKSSRLPH